MPLPVVIAVIALAVVGILALLAVQDLRQTQHALRRVYPLLGRLR